jgi:hypothetical protein
MKGRSYYYFLPFPVSERNTTAVTRDGRTALQFPF